MYTIPLGLVANFTGIAEHNAPIYSIILDTEETRQSTVDRVVFPGFHLHWERTQCRVVIDYKIHFANLAVVVVEQSVTMSL